MHQKWPLHIQQWNFHTKRWSSDDITTRSNPSRNFYGKLEITLVPKLKQHVHNWKRYVDDTFVYVKNDSIKYVLSVLETFHSNIKFTYERKVDNTPPFLGVLFIRNSDHLHTTVYREKAFNNLYLHWHSFAPISWTCETFGTLLNKTYVCMFQQ